MASTTDRDPVSQIATNPTAFEAFYRRHVRTVSRFAARRCDTAADVADVVSTTFLAALDSCGQFDRRRGTPRAWLLGIAAHQITALHRRERLERTTAARWGRREPLREDETAAWQARLEAERLAPPIADALARLPASERELLLLVAYDDLTPSEAASVLGISPVAARVRLSRARQRLRHSAQGLSPGLDQPAPTTSNAENAT